MSPWGSRCQDIKHVKVLTQFDVPIQHEEDVSGLQVSVNDLHAVQVDQSFQHLTTHNLNLRLGQPTIQL